MPIANHFASKDIENSFAKLEPPKRIPENVTVANIPISAKPLFPVDDSLHIFGRKFLSLEIHEVGECVFCPWLNNYFFKDDSWSFIYRNIGQFLARTANSEPLQNGGGLAVILNGDFDFRALEESFDVCGSHIACSEFVNNQYGNRQTRRYVCTDFGSISSFLSSGNGILQNLGLALHVSSLSPHHLNLPNQVIKRWDAEYTQPPFWLRIPLWMVGVSFRLICLAAILLIWGGSHHS